MSCNTWPSVLVPHHYGNFDRSPPEQHGDISSVPQSPAEAPGSSGVKRSISLRPSCPWVVTKCQGSLRAARRATEQIACNVSCLEQFQLLALTTNLGCQYDFSDINLEVTSDDGRSNTSVRQASFTNQDGESSEQSRGTVTSPDEVVLPVSRANCSGYGLRNNPAPSTWLRDHLV
ncbi:hypothetical protein NDU88_004169 [Pleurodeles waltl]|uniref:Uncharacterized protein n=1 Tax=Pleurodeles waltl TaxID=8319 RepID=A0AAV7WTT5_PLEWA|nr:hypothetical protein NDU88_004169 [Pleurodeles waltl]